MPAEQESASVQKKRKKKKPAESESERKARYYKDVVLTKEVKDDLQEWVDTNSVSVHAPNLNYADVRAYMLKRHSIKVSKQNETLLVHLRLLFEGSARASA